MWGLPIELIAFAGVMIPALLFTLLTNPSGSSKLEKRAGNLKKRTHANTAANIEAALSLRRKTGDESLPLINRLMQKFNLNALKARLERAGMEITIERYIVICIALFAGTLLLTVLLGKQPLPVAFFVGIVIGVGLPHMVSGFKAGRRLKRFILLFPDAIDLIVRGLRSGLPVTESVHVVAKELPDPVGSVFTTMSDSMKLGVGLETVLTDMARKLNLTEFNFFVTTIILQRETGGNLSEILGNLSDVLRKRVMMKLKIKSLTSEARASAMIIGALPFVVMGALAISSPGYLDPLFDDYRGNIAGIIALLSLSTGIGLMVRMSKFEI